jgi:hypothetical protein
MKKQSIVSMTILMTVFIILSLGIAGCSSQAPPASPASPASPVPAAPPLSPATDNNLSTAEPSQMALQPSDVPANFTRLEHFERNLSDMRSWAVDKGWKKGYYAYYEKTSQKPQFIEQTISVYPAENISLVMPDTVQNVKNWSAEENMSVEELPVPGIGDSSRALKVSENGGSETDYLITFVKYDVYEELWTNGTATDYDTLKHLAGTAAARIK